jgi:endonuclease-3
VTAVLFEKYNTPQKMLTLSQKELESYIFSCGFYRMKAEHILSASKDIVEKYDGEVPNTVEELTLLAGVGKKTANVVYSVWFGGAAIAVDTHVFRVAARVGLSRGAKTPLQTELQLEKNIPSHLLPIAHHWLILHGRYVCTARAPRCEECGIKEWCREFLGKKSEK